MATLNRLVTVFSANTTSFTAGTKRMQKSMIAFKASVLGAGKAVNSAFNRMALAAGVSAGLMIKHYAEFEKRMASVGAILKKTGGVYGKEMKSMVQLAKRMGRTTIFTATQAAEAQEVMAMAGLSQKEIMMALGPALQLAAVGEVEIAEAAEIAAKTMRGMNLSASDLYKVNNVLAGALTTSTTNMTQLGNALKYVAPLAAATNTTIENTVAMIGKLSSAGFQGEMAGTGLRQAMAKLAGSTPHATKVLKDYGIVTLDAAGNMLPMFDILFQMEEQALSAGQVFEIFGARAGPQMLALLSVGVEGLEAYSDSLTTANNDMLAAQIEQKKLDTIWGAWKLMISAVSGVIIDASEDIAATIRRVQARFVEFFNNLDNRAAVINGLSAFMESFIRTLENLLVWIKANSEGLLEFASAMGSVIGGFFNFLAQYPQIMAALIALKIAGLLGLTQAAWALGRAVVHLVIVVFPQLLSILASVKSAIMAATASLSRFAVAMGSLAIGAFVIGLGAIQIAQMGVNREVQRGIRLLRQLRNAQMESIDADMKKAMAIKDGEDRLRALAKIQQKVIDTHELAEIGVKAEREQLQLLEKRRVEYEKRVRKEMGDTLGEIELLLRETGIGKVGKEYKEILQQVEQSKATLKDAKFAEKTAKRRKADIEEVIEMQKVRVEGEAGGAADEELRYTKDHRRHGDPVELQQLAPNLGGAAGGMFGGGAGGGAFGKVGDVAKAIADRVKDTMRTEERETFGRAAGREGAELGKFMGLGPAKDELIEFLNTLGSLTTAEVERMTKQRSEHIALGIEISEADEFLRQDALIRMSRHHEELKRLEDIKALQDTQKKAGSLREQLDADTSMSGWNIALREEMDILRQHLDAGVIPAQVYSEQLSRIQTAYSTATSVLDRLNRVQRTKAEQESIAQGTLKTYIQQFRELQADYLSGVLNTSQYKFAIRDLTQAMRDSTQAAKEEEAAEKAATEARRRKISAAQRGMAGAGRGGGGGGAQGPSGPAHPMDTLLAQLSMAQGRMQLLHPSGLKYSRNVKAFRARRAAFGQAQLDVAQIQRAISNMRMQLMSGPLMAMQRGIRTGARLGGDPGLVTHEGNITIELPNVTRVDNEDIASLADRLDEERQRRGRNALVGFSGRRSTFG